MKRLLTIGHSYVVAQNRRLAHEMALAGAGEWDVTVAAPARLRGDLREIAFEPIAREACHVRLLPMRWQRMPHLRTFGGDLDALLRERWDVVHCWEEPYVAAAAQIAARVPQHARFVPATFQNIAKTYPPPFSWIEQRVMRRADGWIAFGRTIFETHAGRAGYRGKPSVIITPGVDTETFKPDVVTRDRVRRDVGFSGADVVMGYVGRFVAEKGITTLLEACVHARGSWKLMFVGGGPMRREIEEARAATPDRIRVVTDVPHDRVAGYMNAMDVLCAPSRTTASWREQFGRMLIEAQACGVPVVASPSGEIPHVVGDAGLLVEECNSRAWAEQLDALEHDADRRRALGTRGLEQARTRFAWPVIARQHLRFFDEVCRA